jgi:hypothetical protein
MWFMVIIRAKAMRVMAKTKKKKATMMATAARRVMTAMKAKITKMTMRKMAVMVTVLMTNY